MLEREWTERHWWLRDSMIASVGLAVRVAFVWFGARGDGPVGDQLFYSAQAIANARGDWFEQPFAQGMPAADHPPVTALVLTPITWLFQWTDSIVTLQRLFVALMGSISILVVARIARDVADERVGLIAACVTALYVNVWINDGLIMAETPTFLLVGLLTLFCLRSCRRPTRWRFAAVGLLAGLAALTRPELVALIPASVILFVAVHKRHLSARGLALGVALVVGVAGAVTAPWVIWNQLRFDAPVLLSTNDGLTIAGANCDRTFYEDVGGWDIWCAYATDVPRDVDASTASELMRQDGLAYWRENLDRYPVVAAARLARVFSLGYVDAAARAAEAEGRPVWLSHLGAVQYWLLIPLAVVGARKRVSAMEKAVLLGTIPIVAFVALVANAYVRFRVPAELGLIVLASAGVGPSMAAMRRVTSRIVSGQRSSSV